MSVRAAPTDERPVVRRLPGAVDLFVHPTARFKTSLLNILLHRPLDEDVAAAALLPALLRRGTRTLPDLTAISRRLEELFGAGLDVDVFRFGERQILSIRIDFVDERYLFLGGKDLLGRAFDLLREVLLEPKLVDGRFPADVFEQERRNLARFVAGTVNDKGRYAFERCVGHMCAEEPYRRFEYGDEASIEALSPEDVVRVWRDVLSTSPLEIYFVGRANPERIAEHAEARFSSIRDGSRVAAPPAPASRRPAAVRRIVEAAELAQSRLVMGYRVDGGAGEDRACRLVVWNTLFGGGTFSRLFRNIREKRSLAYYCSSSLDQAKGVAFVQAGIDAAKAAEVEELVGAELAELAAGRIELAEFRAAKEQLKGALRAMADSPSRIAGWLQERQLGGWVHSFEDAFARVARVRRDDVAEAARSIRLDTVYRLGGEAS